jgi:hypothetical protein
VGEGQNATSVGLTELNEPKGACVYLGGRLAARTPVLVELPAWAPSLNFLCRDAFVLAVIELAEERRQVRIREAGNLSRAHRALQRAGIDRIEAQAAEPPTQRVSLSLAFGREREVGVARVPAVAAPLGLAVTGEIDVERQAGLPIISGRPERNERLALSITAPARTRWPGRMHTNPTAAWPPVDFSASLTAERTRLAA